MKDYINSYEDPNKMEKIDPKFCFQEQLSLEGLKIIEGNRIKKFNTDHFDIEKNESKNPPKIVAVNFGDEINIFYSDLMPNNLVANLEKLEKRIFIDKQGQVVDILKENNQFHECGHCIVYAFPSNIEVDYSNTKIFTNSKDQAVKNFDSSFYNKYPTIYAAMQNDKIFACCVSSRENDKAGEAWIYTSPKYRKQGFGLKAVQLWASELRKNGKTPLYTHEISNVASQKLAEKLGLVKVFESINYE